MLFSNVIYDNIAPARSAFVRGATRGAKYKPQGRGLGRRNTGFEKKLQYTLKI